MVLHQRILVGVPQLVLSQLVLKIPNLGCQDRRPLTESSKEIMLDLLELEPTEKMITR